jgi:hypothetical protein
MVSRENRNVRSSIIRDSSSNPLYSRPLSDPAIRRLPWRSPAIARGFFREVLTMAGYIWTRKSKHAKGWLIGALLVQGVFWVIAATNPRGGFIGPVGHWENREAIMLVSMLLLLASAMIMHAYDIRKGAWGFQDIYRNREHGELGRDEEKFITPVLTAESIRAAMTAGILAILLDDRQEYLPHDTENPFWFSVPAIVEEPKSVFFVMVVGALSASLATTMAALLCYEYATRFVFASDWPRLHLLNKGFHFGKLGFYCLMWSLAVVPVLVDYNLAFVSITFVFGVMWLYYFFPTDAGQESDPVSITGA